MFCLAASGALAQGGSMLVTALCLIAFAYFCGALPFGYWAGRMKGIDIRKHGSGNIGATNVLRVLGKGVGIPVFLLDILKGAIPVMLAEWVMEKYYGPSPATYTAILCAVAAVLGHTYTFWLGFKGGKGVATSAGVLVGLSPWALVIALAAWIITLVVTRYVSLASIVAAIVLPIAMAVMMTVQGRWNTAMFIFGLLAGFLVVIRHRSNIQRIIRGTESRMGAKKTMTEPKAQPKRK